MAMVGGGVGAFIGKVHRAAARFNGDVEFVAGALSSDPVRSREQGIQLGLRLRASRPFPLASVPIS